MSRYTKAEIMFLHDNHATMTGREIGDVLGRDHNSVNQKLRSLGLEPCGYVFQRSIAQILDEISKEVLLENGCGDLINV